MIIAFEGIEGSGRTAHLEAVRKYLEKEGYGVITFGIQMSKLMGERISQVKKNIVFERRTLFLAYVTDLADQMENYVKPSIDSGFIALADGYVLTLMSWGLARGLEENWMKDVLSVFSEPVTYFSLVSKPEEIMKRIIKKKGYLDPLSAGIDICVKEDIFSAYEDYINKFQHALISLSNQENIVNTDRNFDEVNKEIVSKIENITS
ncbi:dTMP kinase [Acidianus manzaensis]|uniref:Thymidylate kinase n=1 Tax=Acidianus manzaensis TaxID=282676 RepID=A0A1W6JZG8_9CREN|nr:thymidylate kinase [Acidianus manzaensis]ARM75625.1 thymidylate kinase [Acidianus manzaensis]